MEEATTCRNRSRTITAIILPRLKRDSSAPEPHLVPHAQTSLAHGNSDPFPPSGPPACSIAAGSIIIIGEAGATWPGRQFDLTRERQDAMCPMQTSTLLAYLAHEISAPIVHKALSGGEYVLFGDYMPRAHFLFETSAVLGYAFRDRLLTFVSLFSQPGHEVDLAEHLGDSVAARLASLEKEPSDFMELFFIPEATRLIGVLRNAGLTTCTDWTEFGL